MGSCISLPSYGTCEGHMRQFDRVLKHLGKDVGTVWQVADNWCLRPPSLFNTGLKLEAFSEHINSAGNNIKFTGEHAEENRLPFLSCAVAGGGWEPPHWDIPETYTYRTATTVWLPPPTGTQTLGDQNIKSQGWKCSLNTSWKMLFMLSKTVRSVQTSSPGRLNNRSTGAWHNTE